MPKRPNFCKSKLSISQTGIAAVLFHWDKEVFERC